MESAKESKRPESQKCINRRSKSSSSKIENTLYIVLETEVLFLAQIKNFASVFLDSKTHSLEDMYLHQIEVPEARKLVGFDAHSSLICMIFNKIIVETEASIELLKKLLANDQKCNAQHKSNQKITLREFCNHIESNISILFRAAYLCWEWILQAIDFWRTSESNFSARLPDFVEKFIYHQPNIQNVVEQLLTTFYDDLAIISESPGDVKTKFAFLIKFFKFETVLENIFTLPLVRALNYTHILKILEANTPEDHFDYLGILKAQKSFSIIVRPIFKRVKEYNKLEEVAKELPTHLHLSVSLKDYLKRHITPKWSIYLI